MKWFGTPWPSPEFRAGVCENDVDRIPVPVGEACASCDQPIGERDRGLELPYVAINERTRTVVASRRFWHLGCFLALTLGPQYAKSFMEAMPPP